MTQFWQLGCLSGIAGLLLASPLMDVALAGDGGEREAAAAIAQSDSLDEVWQAATAEEEERFWDIILNSPLGIAALNQLAIEGFVSPLCDKSLYTHAEYGGFQTLLQVQCPDATGISIARPYSEVRVTFNRFEDNVESFELERVYKEN